MTLVEHRVYGPPGCGKTTWLSRQAVRAADKYGRGGVAVASLTRAAAQEVAGRDTGIPKQNIGTLHAHAYRALKAPALMETAEGIQAWNEWVPLASLRMNPRNVAADPENATVEVSTVDARAEELLMAAGVYRARMVDEKFWPGSVRDLYQHWCEFKQESGRVDFTDLLETCLQEGVELLSKPAVFMLDEAQDFSRLEMALARQWGAECDQLVVVGDPDQNLYEWRGSDPNVFGHGEVASTMVLEQSYRVPLAVRDTALDWISQVEERKPVVYRPREAAIGTVERCPATWDDPATLIQEIERHVWAGQRVMVLASCSYMLQPLVQLCRTRALPFHNPYRVTQGAWNPMRSVGKLLAFLRPDVETWGDESRFWTWGDLKKWTEPLRASGNLQRGVKNLIEAKCEKDRFGDSRRDQEVSASELFLNLLEEGAREPAFGTNIDWWESALRDAPRKSQRFALDVARARGRAALRETPKLILGTIHSVKGGEADVVYVFPDLSLAGWQDFKGAGFDATIRLFYVAMTRARERLYLCNQSRGEAVRWL